MNRLQNVIVYLRKQIDELFTGQAELFLKRLRSSLQLLRLYVC